MHTRTITIRTIDRAPAAHLPVTHKDWGLILHCSAVLLLANLVNGYILTDGIFRVILRQLKIAGGN